MRAAHAETSTWEVQCPITVLRTSSPSGKTNNLIAPGITRQTFVQHFQIYKGCSHDFSIPGGVAKLGLLREIEEYATGRWKYWRSSLLSLIGRHREGVPEADSWWTRQISEGCIGQGQPHEEEYQTLKLQAHPLLICPPSCTGVSFLKHKTVISCLKRFWWLPLPWIQSQVPGVVWEAAVQTQCCAHILASFSPYTIQVGDLFPSNPPIFIQIVLDLSVPPFPALLLPGQCFLIFSIPSIGIALFIWQPHMIITWGQGLCLVHYL